MRDDAIIKVMFTNHYLNGKIGAAQKNSRRLVCEVRWGENRYLPRA